MEVPFVGRKDTLSEIRRWLNQHKGVIIVGESGSGKTRLIRKYTNDLSLAKHARILISNCRPEETTFPLHPIRELLRRHMTNDEWLALPTVWASNLLAIYPELVELRPDLIQAQLPSDPDQAQGLLFEAIRQAFIIMSVDTPLFVVIDDLHWADEATLNSLAYFLPRAPFSKQASLIAAARLESITPQLKTLQNSIQQSKDGVVINLPELTRNDIAALAKSILETEPSPNFLDHLTRSSGGNSLYVLEILRAIIDTKPGHDFSNAISLPVTENLRKLISSRIQKLSDPTRQILEAASILGHEFDPKIIFAIIDQDESKVIDAIEELEKSNFILITKEHQKTGTYTFVHETIREVLHAEINITRARHLHYSVARELEGKYKDIHSHILAHHYEAAGEYLRAFRFWIRAGDQARELIATSEAYNLYQRANDLLNEVEKEVLDEDIYILYSQWAEMAYNFNETDTLNELGEELLILGNKRKSPSLLGTAYDILSDACFTVNDLTGGLENATLAISHLENSNYLAKHIQAYNHQGVFYYMLGKLSEAKESFEDALALSTGSRSRKVAGYRSHSHYQMALIRTFEGYPEHGCDHAIRAIQDGESSDPYFALFPGLSISALTHYYAGNYQQSFDHAQEGIKLGSKTRAVRLLGYTHSYASMSSLGMGNIGTAVDHAEQAIEIGEKYQLDDVAALGHSQMGNAYRILLDYPSAIDSYQQGVQLGAEHFIGLDNAFRLGLTLHAVGQRDEGYKLLNEAQQAFEFIGIQLGAILSQISMTITYTRAAEWEKARELAIILEQETASRSLNVHHALVTMLLGQITMNDGEPQLALQHLYKAIEIAKNALSPTIELSSYYQLFKIVNEKEKAEIRERTTDLIEKLGSSIKRSENQKRFEKVRERADQEIGIA